MRTVIVADSGIAALRIIRACRAQGLHTVAVYSDDDADAPHVLAADTAYALGGASPEASYLSRSRLLSVLRVSGADAVHPGTTALAADPLFAAAVTRSGACWIGASPEALQALRTVPPTPAVAVPGIKGQVPRLVQFHFALNSAGSTSCLGTYDISLRRRGLPLVVEAPAPLAPATEEELARLAAGRLPRMQGLATVTVELRASLATVVSVHPGLVPWFAAADAVSGVDQVALQLALASEPGGPPRSLPSASAPEGHCILWNITADDAGRGFLPAAGEVDAVSGPGSVLWAVDAGSPVVPGRLGPVAQLLVASADRDSAVRQSQEQLECTTVSGVASVLPFFRALTTDAGFGKEPLDLDWLGRSRMVVPPEPAFSQIAPDTSRRRITVEINGSPVSLGIPARLLEAWLDEREELPADHEQSV